MRVMEGEGGNGGNGTNSTCSSSDNSMRCEDLLEEQADSGETTKTVAKEIMGRR